LDKLFSNWLKKIVKKVIIFKINSKAVLFLKIHKILNTKIGEILFIHVLEKYQRKGLGKKLILSGIDYLFKKNCKAIEVKLSRENKKAFYFYKSIGFKEITREKIYHIHL